jgi:hypothetical protein
MKTLRHLAMSVITWLLTNLAASMMYITAALAGVEFDPFLCDACNNTLSFILLFGLIFSAPFTLLLPFIYVCIERIRYRAYKIFTAMALIMVTCVIVIVSFIHFFGTDTFEYLTVVAFLFPYVIAAEATFLLIGSKMIFRGEPIANRYKRTNE